MLKWSTLAAFIFYKPPLICVLMKMEESCDGRPSPGFLGPEK